MINYMKLDQSLPSVDLPSLHNAWPGLEPEEVKQQEGEKVVVTILIHYECSYFNLLLLLLKQVPSRWNRVTVDQLPYSHSGFKLLQQATLPLAESPIAL
jgi:hypothetical protein